MLALLAVHWHDELRPIELDRTMEELSIVRFLYPAGSVDYFNYIDGYRLSDGVLLRLPEPAPDPREAIKGRRTH